MLLLPFKAMLLSERARGRKSGGPPLFAPFFKVQRNTAHNRNSGLAVLPQCHDLNAHRVRKVPAGNQNRPPMRWRRSAGTSQPANPGLTSGLPRVHGGAIGLCLRAKRTKRARQLICQHSAHTSSFVNSRKPSKYLMPFLREG